MLEISGHVVKFSPYLESSLGHFEVFAVKFQPLLYDGVDVGVSVVHQLEPCDVGPPSLELCEVQVQKTLGKEQTMDLFVWL